MTPALAAGRGVRLGNSELSTSPGACRSSGGGGGGGHIKLGGAATRRGGEQGEQVPLLHQNASFNLVSANPISQSLLFID